jgi:hypothetical protein
MFRYAIGKRQHPVPHGPASGGGQDDMIGSDPFVAGRAGALSSFSSCASSQVGHRGFSPFRTSVSN